MVSIAYLLSQLKVFCQWLKCFDAKLTSTITSVKIPLAYHRIHIGIIHKVKEIELGLQTLSHITHEHKFFFRRPQGCHLGAG